jgi:hypothetical protein
MGFVIQQKAPLSLGWKLKQCPGGVLEMQIMACRLTTGVGSANEMIRLIENRASERLFD